MIGKLKGILSETDGNTGLIETSGGVFYRTFLTSSIIAQTPSLSPIEVYTYLQVKDDDLVLFGFRTKKEYSFFTLLLSVSGVGPKTAYTVVSFGRINETMQAIKSNDVDFFTQIKGLGRKTAMKIILELSQKLKQEFSLDKMYLSDDDKIVVDALMSLGFKSNEVKNILVKLPKNLSIENKIKESLKMIK